MKNRKRVAFVINKLMMGGAENMLVEQTRVLDRSRFISYVVTLMPASKVKLLVEFPEDVIRKTFSFRGTLDLPSLFKLTNFLRKEKIDAVVTNLFDSNLLGRVAAILAGVSTILSYEHNIYADKKKWQILADKILAHFTKKILVGSNEVLEFTAKQEKLPKDKFALNYNSIPMKLGNIKENRSEALARLGLPENNFYIATAGSLTPQKGHACLVDAVYKLKQAGLSGFQFLIFGKGKLEGKLLEQVDRCGLKDVVKLMGIAPAEDIMAISDIFTLPSLWEGLSIALLQAMDARCPIVATRVSGTSEALENEVSALIVEPGDCVGLAKAFERLLKYRELCEKLAEQAKKAVERFSIEKNVKVIENLIWP